MVNESLLDSSVDVDESDEFEQALSKNKIVSTIRKKYFFTLFPP